MNNFQNKLKQLIKSFYIIRSSNITQRESILRLFKALDKEVLLPAASTLNKEMK